MELSLADLVQLNNRCGYVRAAKGIYYPRHLEYRLAFNEMHLQPGSRVLDVGCKHSVLPLYMAERGCEVHAVDLSSSLWQLRSMAQDAGLSPEVISRLHLAQQDACALQYPADHFDAACSIGVVEHIPDDGDIRALREMARVVKPGGYVVVTVEAAPEYTEAWIALRPGGGITIRHRAPEESETEVPSEWHRSLPGSWKMPVYARLYNDQAMAERLYKASGLRLVRFGYYHDKFGNLRFSLNRRNWGWLSPVLSLLVYRHAPSSAALPDRYNAVGYVVLQKPVEEVSHASVAHPPYA